MFTLHGSLHLVISDSTSGVVGSIKWVAAHALYGMRQPPAAPLMALLLACAALHFARV